MLAPNEEISGDKSGEKKMEKNLFFIGSTKIQGSDENVTGFEILGRIFSRVRPFCE